MNIIDEIDKIEKINFYFQRKISISTIQLVLMALLINRLLNSIDITNKDIVTVLVENKFLVLNNIIIFGIVDIVLILIWMVYRKIPKIKKNEIGILFAIRTDNTKIREKIKEDFTAEIGRQISSTQLEIKIVALSEYHAEKIDNKKELIKKYHRKANANFILYGKSRYRTHNGKKHYYIEVNESVKHKPISDVNQRKLLKDMFTVFPRNTMFPCADEVNGFSLNTKLFSYGALYIIGLSCIYSNKIYEAYKLHRRCYSYRIHVSNFQVNKNYERIRSNLRQLLISEINYLARLEYEKRNLENLKYYLEEAKEIAHSSYDIYNLETIYYFLVGDIQKAFEKVSEAKKVSNGDYTWAYNKAFLYAYDGNIEKAYSTYEIAFRNKSAIDVHIQIEQFIREILEKEPQKYQLHYCLGLIYYYIHEDERLAEIEFGKFIQKENENNYYPKIRGYAEQYVEEIQSGE